MDHETLLKLQSALRRIAGSDDALQEANLRLLRLRKTLREPERYAKRVARNQRFDEHRRTRITLSLDAAANVVDGNTTPPDRAVEKEENQRVVTAVQQLPPRQRDAM